MTRRPGLDRPPPSCFERTARDMGTATFDTLGAAQDLEAAATPKPS